MGSRNDDFGVSGQGFSPAPEVSIVSSHGSQVSSPVLSNTSVQGDVKISYTYSGSDSSASAAPSTPDKEPKSVISAYKESILHVYGIVQEYNSLPGEHALLADRYTRLLMVQRHRALPEREEEIRSKGDALHRVLAIRESKDYQCISEDQFFSPTDTAMGEAPRAVILQGHSGMGKSFTAQKIMHDWALGTLFAGTFDVVFHLKCKELNLLTQEKSLMELLNLETGFQPAMVEVLSKSTQKVLFLVDGFDELRFSLNVSSFSFPSDAFTRAPLEGTLRALLQGHILSKSSLLVTTRSSASDRLSKLLKQPQRFIEILGFSEEGVQKYFQRFFKDKELFAQAYGSVRSNESLFAACFIPIICWIICTVLREKFENGTENHMELTTTTSVFVYFVSTLLEHHCQGLSQPIPSLLRSLGQLAERGMMEKQVLFEEKQVLEMISDPASVPFMCKFLLKKNVGKKAMFSFMHLSFQEFFTALFYATADEEECRRKIENLLQKEAEEERGLRIHFMFQRVENDVVPVIQFLFGLSNKELGSILRDSLGLSISTDMHTQLEEWVLKLNSATTKIHNMDGVCLSRERSLDIFSCLYEHHEEELMLRVMREWQRFRPNFVPLSKTDSWVLMNCFQHCPEIRCVHLTDCNLTAEKLRMLKPVISRSKELALQVEGLSDGDVEDLVYCLGEGKILRLLTLTHSSLRDEGVFKVLTSLSKQSSVGSFKIQAFCITLSTLELLLDLLQRNTFDVRVSFKVAVLTVSEDADLRLFMVCIRKNLYPENTDDVIECMQVSAECVLRGVDGESGASQRRLKSFSVQLRPDAEIASIDWRGFFHTCVADNLGLDEQVNAVMGHLREMPGLVEVWMSVSHINESWANGVLQLFLTSPQLKNITCSKILDNGDYSTTVYVCVESYKGMLRLSVKNRCMSSLFERILSSAPLCRLHLPMTCLILILPLSPELPHLDWTGCFRDCLTLQGIIDNAGPGDHVPSLLSFLCGIPELLGMRLDLFPLTETWATGLVSLISTQHTLTCLRLYCGEEGFGPLTGEGLDILLQSQHLFRDILSLTGLKCRVPADQCPTHKEQNHEEQRVELTFTGDSVQEREISVFHEVGKYDDPFRL